MQDGQQHTALKFGASILFVLLALGGLYYLVARSNASGVPAEVPHAVTQSTAATTTASGAPIISFEVVTTEAAQEKGLGGRATIPHSYAMLFVFPKDDQYGFWMKDMLAPIDMVWLSDDHRIVKIDDSVSPDTYPDSFYPPVPVRYVIETRAGEARAFGWNVGTTVTLPKGY